MKTLTIGLLACTAMLALPSSVSAQAPQRDPRGGAEPLRQRALERFDENNDGRLDDVERDRIRQKLDALRTVLDERSERGKFGAEPSRARTFERMPPDSRREFQRGLPEDSRLQREPRGGACPHCGGERGGSGARDTREFLRERAREYFDRNGDGGIGPLERHAAREELRERLRSNNRSRGSHFAR